jgi:hypothetical protein
MLIGGCLHRRNRDDTSNTRKTEIDMSRYDFLIANFEDFVTVFKLPLLLGSQTSQAGRMNRHADAAFALFDGD